MTLPPRTCYVVFDANPLKEYAYDCGQLDPKPSQWVVVLVGPPENPKKKIVKCTSVVEGIDPVVNKKIFAILQEQPTP